MLGVLDSSFWIKLSVILKYPFVLQSSHGSQGFCWERDQTASVVHTFEAVVGSWGSVSAPAVSRVTE